MAQLCKTLALLWFFPSLGAFAILFTTSRKNEARWEDTPIELWCAAGIILVHLGLASLAAYFDRNEQGKTIPASEKTPKP